MPIMGSKLKNFVKLNNFAILLSFVCLLSLVSIFSELAYSIILYVSIILFSLIYDVNKSIIVWLVSIFFEQNNIVLSLPLLALILGINALKTLIKNKVNFSKTLILPIVVTLVLIIWCFTIKLDTNYIKETLSYAVILIIAFELFFLKDQLNFEEIIKYGTLLLITSSISSIFFQLISPKFYIFHEEFNDIKRFVGLTTHENMFATYTIMFMAFNVVLYFKQRLKILNFIIYEVLLFIFGVATMSKTFLILFTVLGLFYFIKSFKIDKESALYQLILFLFFILIFLIIFRNKFINFINRFFFYNSQEGLFSMLTTGRYEIWKNFINIWISSPSNIFFGIGVSYMPYNYVHSFYLDLLIKFGIIGFLLIILLVSYYIFKLVSNKKINLENFIPIIIIALNLSDEVFIAKRIIVLFIAFAGLTYLCTEKKQFKKESKIEGENYDS